MPLVLGLASSHAPSMFTPAERWPEVHRLLTRGVPQPPEILNETPEVIIDYVQRIEAGFGVLKSQIETANLDAMVIVGDDQTEVFSDACCPAFGVFIGSEANGSASVTFMGQTYEENRVTLKGSPELGLAIVEGLMDRGFDPAYLKRLAPLGNPKVGLGHAFTRIARAVGLDVSGMPTVPVFLNGYHPPLPSGERCYDVGRALAEICAERPERIAVFGSGGLSHCPLGPRAGWVDEPLDRWFLECIEQGRTQKLKSLFDFDSDTLRSGTGEMRSWITVAGAFDGKRGVVVDYIPARHAVTGIGFAYWLTDGAN